MCQVLLIKKYMMEIQHYLKKVKKMTDIDVYIGGDMVCSFLTNDNIHQYI